MSSTATTLHSYFSLIQKLKQQPYQTQKELVAHVAKKLDRLREITGIAEKGLSERSFRRDLQDIRTLFGIDIRYDRKQKGYFIADNSSTNDRFLQQMADAFQTMQLLHLNEGLHEMVQPEKSGERDTQHFSTVLAAIQHRKWVSFTYENFWKENPTCRTIAPYLLKEAGQRWYLAGRDKGDDCIKHFALDRMTGLSETDDSFTPPEDKSYEAIYNHTYGIDGPHSDEEAEEDIILSFEPPQGRYVEALPLHTTQEELVNDETEYRIRLQLYITRDLIMKILSYGETVKVLQPQSLINRIAAELETTLNHYRQ